MKRYMLICVTILAFALLLTGCAAEDAPAPAFDAPVAEAPMPADAPPPPMADAADDDFFEFAPEAAFEAEAPAPPAEAWDEADFDMPEAVEMQEYFDANAVPLPIILPDDPYGRRLIYTVNMQLQSPYFIDVSNFLVSTVSEMGGFPLSNRIIGRDMRTPEVERQASYTFRLPIENLAEFVVTVKENSGVLYMYLATEDVTVIYERADWAFDDLHELEQWVTDELDDGELESDERQDLQVVLAQLHSELRVLEQERAELDYDLFYSMVIVQLHEVVVIEEEEIIEEEEEEEQEPTFGDLFRDAVDSSARALQGVLLFIVRALPTLLVLGALTFIIVWCAGKYRKWKKTETENKKKEAWDRYAYYQSLNNDNNASAGQNQNDAAAQEVISNEDDTDDTDK